MCQHNFIHTEFTVVCTLCGIETYFLQNCSYTNCGFSMRHSPFLSGYSRTKRFRGMVDTLFWPTPSNGDEKMLRYLVKKKLVCRGDIIRALFSAPLRDKRFGSIHTFCRLFDPKYKPPPKYGSLFEMQKQLVHKFQMVETRFERVYKNTPFINYAFILAYLLTKLGFVHYLPYVKRLKCERRKQKYNKMLNKLWKYEIFGVHIGV